MKVLLYLEAPKTLSKSGIGRAIKHQKKALEQAAISYTLNPKESYDILHLNTYGFSSWQMLKAAKKAGKKVIMHGHSTEEDFRNSFIGSNQLSGLFKRHLMRFYQAADHIITPTPYAKHLIAAYGITTPMTAISNGIDLASYQPSEAKEHQFRQYFGLTKESQVVISAGLYFERKGLDDFIAVARQLPEVTFIWFGSLNLYLVPKKIRRLVQSDHPKNVIFPGYIKGDIYQGAMQAADIFFFPSREETEGIVVLEALASQQTLVLRDIPVYRPWLSDEAANFAKDVSGFVTAIKKILKEPKQANQAGYKVAKQKELSQVAKQLKAVYQEVMEL